MIARGGTRQIVHEGVKQRQNKSRVELEKYKGSVKDGVTGRK